MHYLKKIMFSFGLTMILACSFNVALADVVPGVPGCDFETGICS
jgi:hypothetical protein